MKKRLFHGWHSSQIHVAWNRAKQPAGIADGMLKLQTSIILVRNKLRNSGLSRARGGLNRRNALMDKILAVDLPTSPKLALSPSPLASHTVSKTPMAKGKSNSNT
jgi:hypothetical protein